MRINGISISSANSNTVGGTPIGARNLISGNTNCGVEIYYSATANAIQGNYIGPNVTGQSALANKLSGVRVWAPGNIIGGSASGAGNLISGNGQDGILLYQEGAANNIVQGNLIGTTASGTGGLKNIRAGVGITDAPGNTIGGTSPGAGNLISANADTAGDAGIFLFGSAAAWNTIQGNKIGTDITGTLALGNTHEGIYLEGARSNTIGGIVSGAGNLISANKTRGIFLVNARWNVIQGNLVGTKQDGVSALGQRLSSPWSAKPAPATTPLAAPERRRQPVAFAQSVYAGVRIRDGSTNNAVLGNAIFSNGGIGH